MTHWRLAALGWVTVALLLAAGEAAAEPYLAVQNGYRCVQCHVNPTGGALRNDFGTLYSRLLMPMIPYPDSAPNWTGKVFSFFRMGGDLRATSSSTAIQHQPTQSEARITQFRAYANLELLPDKAEIYADELLAPGDATAMQFYGRINHPGTGIYLKGGRMYLPFGWRLQDNSSFVRGVSGISMTTPDEGLELGLERQNISAQIDVSKGGVGSRGHVGDRVTGQFVWVQPDWRLGGAFSKTNSPLGDRQVVGLFAGRRFGKVAWLGEADLVRDAGYPQGARQLLALLGEADWAFARGQNLKLTAEFFDPDLKVSEDAQTRWSLLYELTPVPFIQVRAGWRRYQGIPQSDFQNRRLLFLELHGFF